MQIEWRPISIHYANIIAISHAKHSINVNQFLTLIVNLFKKKSIIKNRTPKPYVKRLGLSSLHKLNI